MMHGHYWRRRGFRRATLLCALNLCVSTPFAQNRTTAAPALAVRDVRLTDAADAPRKTLLLSDGRIAAILDLAAAIPPGYRLLEAQGRIAAPAFLDTWTSTGVVLPPLVVDRDLPPALDANVAIDMRSANRKGIRPATRAVDFLQFTSELAGRHRAQGFAALLAAPGGELLAGWSTLLVAADKATRELVVQPTLFQHASLRASGSGYPTTTMGYFAQLRQYFYDVEHQAQLESRYAQGRKGVRPPYDPDLAAGPALIRGEERIVCEANRVNDIERWLALADEFSLKIAIAGGREAWKLADELARRRVPVLLTLDWGEEIVDPRSEKKPQDEPELGPAADHASSEVATGAQTATTETAAKDSKPAKPWDYVEPYGVRLEKRLEWERVRDCAKRLHEAGVAFAFASGAQSPGDLLKNARVLVESGLPEDVALAALSARAAELLGVERQFGHLRPGHSASFGLWTERPLAKDAELAWLCVEGQLYEFEIKGKKPDAKPDAGVELGGSWNFAIERAGTTEVATAELKMDPKGGLSGTISLVVPQTGDKLEALLSGQVDGSAVHLEAQISYQGMEIKLSFDGAYKDGNISGERSLKSTLFEDRAAFTATRIPAGSPIQHAQTGDAQ